MIAVIDYGMGNTGSIINMLRKLGADAVLTADADILHRAQGLILPGVGAFDQGMLNIHERGLTGVLNECVLRQRIPILGICLGMQLFARSSEEGKLPGLGWLEADVRRFQFPPGQHGCRVPHMGWNEVKISPQAETATEPAARLFEGSEPETRFYFVHTFHACCTVPSDVLATAHYGYDFTAAMGRGHIMGTQFHPEKSLKFGLRLMSNYVRLTECARIPASP
jgi:imidazole glycerol-phosphate synthase subunit HisH